MLENLTSKPFILALHEDHARTVRELRDEEMQHVVAGASDDDCIETVIFTPDCTEGDYAFDCA